MTVVAGLEEMTLDQLWHLREDFRMDAAEIAESKGRIEQELLRRALEANPDFGPEAAGSVQLAGDDVVIAVTYSRTYEPQEAAIMELATMTSPESGPPLITEQELKDLVSYEPKINGTVFNSLRRRGGPLAEVLRRCRYLKSSSVQFTPKERAT